MRKTFTLLGLVGFLILSAQYHSFNYVGALSSNGWTSHSGTLGQQSTLQTASDIGNSLNYTGIPSPVGNRAYLTSTQSEDVNLAFAQPVLTTAYISFLMKVTDVGTLAANTTATAPGYFMHFSALFGNDLGSTGIVSRLSLRKGSSPNTFNIGILNTTGGTTTVNDIYGGSAPTDYQSGTTYLVVLKYDMTGTNGQTSLWINPAIAAEGTPTHTSAFGTSSKLTQVASVALRQANNIGNIEIDELRLGNSWNEVINSGSLSANEFLKNDDLLISNTLVDNHFKLLTKDEAQIQIYSLAGNLVKKGTFKTNNIVDVSMLAKGAYFVIISNGKIKSTVKIIKK